MRKYLSILLFSVLSVLPLMGQQPLGLDSCLRLARQHNCSVQTARLEVLKAHELKRQMFTKYFPQVQGSLVAYHALSHLLGVTPSEDYPEAKELFDRLLGEEDEEVGLMNKGWSVSATAVQPIFMGGRVVNANRYAKVGIEVAELQAAAAERDVLQEVQSSYLLLQGLQEKVATVEAAMTLLDSLDRVVGVGQKAGVLEPSDALRLELKRNEMRAKQLQLQNGIRLAGKLLCHQIGIPYPESGLTLEPVDDITVTPAGARPEYRLLQLNLRSEQFKKKLTLGEALPQVALGGTYFYGDLLTNGSAIRLLRGEDFEYHHNGLLFLTATLPLTAWWETAHKLRQHNLSIRQAELMQNDLTGKLRLQEEQYESEMLEAEALMRSDSAALRLAEENYRVVQLNYANGLSTMTEVLEANALLLEAQNALTDRRIAYLGAKRRLMDCR